MYIVFVTLDATSLVFIVYALRWLYPGRVRRPKSQVIDAVDDNGVMSFVPKSGG